MLKFSDGLQLKKWFGEFGGGFCINDTANERYKHPEIDAIESLKTDEFEANFRKVLAEIDPEINVKNYTLNNGVNVTLIPALGIHYNLAAHVALALTQNKTELYNGTYNKDTALVLAKLANKFNLKLSIHLGAEICKDEKLVSDLKALGAEVDDKLSDELFNMPYAYVLAPFTDPLPGIVVTDTANYGDYPGPALAGLLAGLYGEDVKEKLGVNFDAIVAPTIEGTTTIGLFKAFKNEKVDLISVEEVIGQEYAVIDHNCYSICVRRSDHDEMKVTMCPELLDMYRSARVARLGANRVKKYDLDICKDLDVDDLTKRAIALAIEDKDYKNILVMEAE